MAALAVRILEAPMPPPDESWYDDTYVDRLTDKQKQLFLDLYLERYADELPEPVVEALVYYRHVLTEEWEQRRLQLSSSAYERATERARRRMVWITLTPPQEDQGNGGQGSGGSAAA